MTIALSIPDNRTADVALDKIARTATATSAWFQRGQDHFARMFEIDLGAWTDADHNFTFETSNDGSTVAAVLDATELDDVAGALDSTLTDTVSVIDASRDDTLIQIGILRVEAYARVVQTVTNSPVTGLISGVKHISMIKRAAGGAGQPMSVTGITRTDPLITQ